MKVKCIKSFTVNGIHEISFKKDEIYPIITDEHNGDKFVLLDCYQVSYKYCKRNFEEVRGNMNE